ncbi:carbohydrate binding protein with CBM9 domain [Winogradskyella pacifica]|uniref:Carbohydrate binding protein with CBM9 domain n=1 Tax=Winogradskyella pacifica TaxID=664642 RepID=A0A3D9MZW0_9FLAO|nr:DUF5916 domain-containing protein [Winogradskyella pacifica]REE25752.1 carbohydrate binding protein with CBM9 domain [Winogradskyella pacifica]
MNARSLILLLTVLGIATSSIAQNKKTLNIQRSTLEPKIDGILDDAIWKNAEMATGFLSNRPEIGKEAPHNERTEVKMTYDDKAIYVAAYLYDDPSKIMKQLTNRDNFGQTDYFILVLNPNNDAQNDTAFYVFSSGQQADAIQSPTIGEDFGWNAVWDSAVKIVDDGWIVEMKIPYRTLRFADQDEPTWGVQFHREFRRSRSRYTWNPIDPTQGYSGLYHAEVKGLKDVKPPVRLNLYPFTTGIINNYDGDTDTDLKFGMDVKYGLTDNFTLDATLVPDFSQAGFDNVVLNLGPFEQTFSEQRQFFTEGVDLFSKGDLFFSRRIGNRPSGQLSLDENENVTSPNEVKVLNAVKVSGRTKNGLGIGFFNAITEKTTATIKNSVTDEKRNAVVEPFANYNILVVDQQFNGNSSVSLINTNVLREGHFRDANATALVANIINKRNTYSVATDLRMSNVNYQNTNSETGFSSYLKLAKIHGNLRYSLEHSFADTKFDINDLGLLLRNNYNNFSSDISYQTFEPSGNLNNYSVSTYFNYNRLAKPNVYAQFNLGASYQATTTNLDGFGFNLSAEPGKQNDYFESRDGRPFIYENYTSAGGWISSNYNRIFAFDFRVNAGSMFEDGRDLFNYDIEVEPRVRLNDKLLFIYQFYYDFTNGGRGFATEEDNQPIFGERNRQIITNSVSVNYAFNPYKSIALSFRHYWDTVKYDNDLFTLLDSGRLTTASGYALDNISSDPNINFSTWNIDLSYSWQFAPGSFLTALYRNQLFNLDTLAEYNYSESVDTLFEQPMQHTLSVRLQYFIDFNGMKSLFNPNKSDS